MRKVQKKDHDFYLNRIDAFFPAAVTISTVMYLMLMFCWSDAIYSGKLNYKEGLLNYILCSSSLFYFMSLAFLFLFVLLLRRISKFIPEKLSYLNNGYLFPMKAQIAVFAALTAVIAILLANRFFITEMNDFGAAPGLFYVHKADAGGLVIIFSLFIFMGIILRNRKVSDKIIFAGYFVAALLTYYSLLYTNPFRADALHTIAYINSIVNCVYGAPFDEFTSSTYGHYGLFYVPLVNLLVRNTDAVVSSIALFGVFAVVMMIYVCHNITDNKYISLITVIASLTVTATMRYSPYWQCFPHRILFPLIISAYLAYLVKHDKFSFKYEIIGFVIAGLSFIWNTEMGVYCIVALAIGFIVHKWQENYWYEKSSLIYCVKIIALGIASAIGAILFVNIYNILCGGKFILKEYFFPLNTGFATINSSSVKVGNNAWVYTVVLFIILIAVGMYNTTFFRKKSESGFDKYAPLMCFVAFSGMFNFSYYAWRAAYYNLEVILPLACIANLFIFSKFLPHVKTLMTERKSFDQIAAASMSVICYLVVSCMAAQIVFAVPTLKAKKTNGFLTKNNEIQHYTDVIRDTVPDDIFVVGQGANLLWLELGRKNCGKYRDIADITIG